MKSVRTYLKFSPEIDPAHILTTADLEISMALSSTLVTFNNEREIVAGLAEKWEILPPHQIKFILRDGLKWSNGSKIKAREYKDALERAKRLYAGDLKALFDLVDKIEVPDDKTVIFTTKGNVNESGILLKLTEPMYGLLSMKGEKLDLSRSAGPYVIKEEWADELVLSANPNWYDANKVMPMVVEIRRPKEGQGTVASFEKDEWANLISTSSLMTSESKEHLTSLGFGVRQRSLDKVYGLFASKRFLKEGGAALLKNLAGKLDRVALMNGLAGFANADQFFPRGYILYSPASPKIDAGSWSGKETISMAVFSSPTLEGMRNELSKEISKIAGQKVDMRLPSLTQSNETIQKGDFDILVMSLAVADPNFEGAMSFFIERHPPMIQSMGGALDFAAQVRDARGLPTIQVRAERMRKIILAAQEAGHFVPLFHFSSLAIAKPGIDLSGVSNSDEVVPFSKVRMQ